MSRFKTVSRLFFLAFLVMVLPVVAGAEPAPAPTASQAHGTTPTPSAESASPAATQAKPAEAKPPAAAQSKPSTATPADAKASTKPTEAKPAADAAKPAEAKPSAPAQPAGAKAAEAKPGAEPKPGETKPLWSKTEDETGDQKTAKPSDEKPSVTAEPKSDAVPPKPDRSPGQAAAAEAEPAKPAGKQILVNVDKTTQEMTVFVDGIEEHRWPVSTGVYGYTTPSGSYTATSMNEIWYSKQWDNAPMPHAIFFTKKGHAIHGSLEVKKLGRAASHGCVRLSPKNAKALFQLVKANGLANTQVVIDGETPGGEARVASQPRQPRYGEYDRWGGQGYYPPPPRYYPPQQRRRLFGRRWFDPYGAGPQGYYRPPRGYYRPY